MQHTCCFSGQRLKQGSRRLDDYLMSQTGQKNNFLLSVLLLIGTCPFIWQFLLNKKKHLSHWLFCSKLQKIHEHCVAFPIMLQVSLCILFISIFFVIVKQLTMVKNLLSTYYVSITRGGLDTKISLNPQRMLQVGSVVSHQLYRWEDGLAERATCLRVLN